MRLPTLMALLCLFLSTPPAVAQSEAPDRPNSLAAGTTALQLVIKAEPGNAFGSGFQGAIKHHHSDTGALRIGFGVDWRQRDQAEDGVRSDVVDGDTPFTRRDDDQLLSFSGDVLWIGYPVRGGLVNMYWGLGPTAGFERRETLREDASGDPIVVDRRDDRTVDTWSLGGKALLGVEWFAIERVSLYMEYRTQLVYSSESGEIVTSFSDQSTAKSDLDGSGWDVDSDAVLVGLAAYF